MPDQEITKTEAPLAPAKPGGGEEMWRYASALAKASIIPKDYRGQTANCFVALDMAQRLGAGVMEIMQNTFVVHGTPGFSAKYAIGMANKKGPFKGPIAFEYSGTPGNESVTAYATVAETGDRVEFTADMAMAKAEGWSKNTKYKSMPKLMLSYRAATLLIRLYCPEVLLGMQTAEELEEGSSGPPREVEVDVLESLNREIASDGDLPPDELLAGGASQAAEAEAVPDEGEPPEAPDEGEPPEAMF